MRRRRSPKVEAFFHAARLFFDSFLIRNQVLLYAVGICPIVAAGVKLRYGVVLAISTALILLPVHLIMWFIGTKLPDWLRPIISIGIATLIVTLIGWFIYYYVSIDLFAKLYIFLPLIAVSALVSTRSKRSAEADAFRDATLDTIGSVLGFGLIICLVSLIRELTIYGTLWDVAVDVPFTSSVAALPFFAFIVLGLLAALARSLFSLSPSNRDNNAGDSGSTDLRID